MKAVTRWLGLALVLLAGTALCLRAGNAPERDNTLLTTAPVLDRPDLVRAHRVTSSTTRLVSRALGLVALTQAAQTTFLVLDEGGKVERLAGPLVVDESTVMMRDDSLAYLVLPGLDPTENYIEAWMLTRGAGWQILPEQGSAIFGFAMDPQGARLVYLEADVRMAGSRVPWWVVIVDLTTGTKSVILDGAQLGSVAMLPFAWSPETILFRGLTPFTDQHHGLWATGPDGGNLRPIATEADYVGMPQLSLEGDRLALLVSDPSSRPVAYGAGEPPANAIRILDLGRGESMGKSMLVGPPSAQSDFVSLEWTRDGLLAIGGEWEADRNAFIPRSVIEFQPGTGVLPEISYSASEAEMTHLAACPDGGWLAALQFEDKTLIIRAGQAEPVAKFAGPDVSWLACVAGQAGRLPYSTMRQETR